MPLNNKQYREMIPKYHHGSLSDNEMHLLEMAALEDDFLSDALDGFSINPSNQLLNSLEQEIDQKITNTKRQSFYRSFIAPIVILGFLTIIIRPHHTEISSSISSHTIEKNIPTIINIDEAKIEKAIILPETEWIQNLNSPNNLPDKGLAEKDINKWVNQEDIDPITINTPSPIEQEIERKTTLQKQKTSVYYLYDLKVLNYKKIRNNNLSIREINQSLSARYENKNRDEMTPSEQKPVLYTEFLTECMNAFKKKNLKSAMRGFNTILRTYPHDANALFYGGLTYYNLGMTDKSIELLTLSSEHALGVFKEESEWNLALALIANDDQNTAYELLDKIATSDHFYREQAKAKLNSIKP